MASTTSSISDVIEPDSSRSPERNWLRIVSASWVIASSAVNPRNPHVPLIVWNVRKMLASRSASFGRRSNSTISLSRRARFSLLSIRNSRTTSWSSISTILTGAPATTRVAATRLNLDFSGRFATFRRGPGRGGSGRRWERRALSPYLYVSVSSGACISVLLESNCASRFLVRSARPPRGVDVIEAVWHLTGETDVTIGVVGRASRITVEQVPEMWSHVGTALSPAALGVPKVQDPAMERSSRGRGGARGGNGYRRATADERRGRIVRDTRRFPSARARTGEGHAEILAAWLEARSARVGSARRRGAAKKG